VIAIYAVEALRRARMLPQKRFVFLWTSDEEVGSHSSQQTIEREARRSDVALVLEPAFGPGGCVKTERKGVGTVELIVTGRAAHAGINPREGVNAVHELALQIAQLVQLSDPRRGITVQPTVIEGGQFSNVIPEHARAKLDVRVARLADARWLQRKLRQVRPILKGARLKVRGGVSRPPLERTAAVRKLFRHARGLAREMGVELGEASTGGGSDGNFCAALGVPTLDGLGGVGGGAHSPREHILIRALPERAALLAGLLASL
jgi:glutamate carboxypeptidase